MNAFLANAVAENKWSVWMMNRYGQWVRIDSSKDEATARKKYKQQPSGYAYRLYDNTGHMTDSKGDDTVIVMG